MSKHNSVVIFLMFFACQIVWSQAASDPGRSTGTPATIYHGTDLENVDTTSGNLRISLPLLHFPGRGLDSEIVLSYNSKLWQSMFTPSSDPFGQGSVAIVLDTDNGSLAGPTTVQAPPASPGWSLGNPRMGYLSPVGSDECAQTDPVSGNCLLTISHSTWVQYDGTRIGLVSRSDGITPIPPNGELASFDGSFALLTSRGLIYKDGVTATAPDSITRISTLTDTNGNRITCTSSSKGSLAGCVDTVGRQITVTADPTTGLPQTMSYLDSTGTSRNITFQYGSFVLKYPFAAGNTMCRGGGPTASANATLLTSVTLANGLSYQFQYFANSDGTTTGEISKITLPTGGYIRYVYGFAPVSNDPGLSSCGTSSVIDYIAQDRVVINRVVSPDGTASSEQTWSYTTAIASQGLVTKVTDPLGNSQAYTRDPGGMPSMVQQIDSMNAAGTILKTIKNVVEQGTGSGGAQDPYFYFRAFNNPRVKNQTVVLSDTNQQSQTTFTYGTFNNVIEKDDTDWGAGSSGAVLRKTTMTYLADSNAAYAADTVHILDRGTGENICDSTGAQCAKTTTAYDSTTLTSSSNVIQHDYAGFSVSNTLRGNVTQISRLLTANNTWLTTTNSYNDVGNLVQHIDPNQNTTSFSFADNYYNFTPPQPTSAYGTKITEPPTNGVAHVQRTQYYFNSGLPSASCGENFSSSAQCAFGLAPPQPDYTTYSYDRLNRVVTTTHGDSGQTTVTYSETSLPISISSTTAITSDKNLIATTVFDGLGRTKQSQLNSDPMGTAVTDITYDALGRRNSVSNPYRSTSDPTYGLTRYQYDGLGRVTQTTKQDGSASRLSYAGNCITATDETGKPRKSCSDGLGRLIEVDEPNAASNGTNATANAVISGSLQTVNSVADSGTVSLTSGGFTATACYGSSTNSFCNNKPVNNSTAQVASALASAFNVPSSPISATTSGATLSLVWNTPGPFFSSVSALATTHDQTNVFANPSFTSAATMFDHGTGPSLSTNPYVTLYQYDALGNLLCVEQHGAVTGTGCSANPSQDATSPWRVRRFTYDSLSRLVTATNPESGIIANPGSGSITYFYDSNGNLLQKVSPAPNQTGTGQHTVSYCYDALNRVNGKAYSWQNCQSGQLPQGTAVVTYRYDSGTNGIGHLTSLTDQAGSAAYSYDIMGRVSSESQTTHGIINGVPSDVSKNMSYTYYFDGSVNTITYPSGAIITYALDSAGRAVSAIDDRNVQYVSGATYAPYGALTGFISGQSGIFNGITNTTVYDVRLQPCRMTASSSGAMPTDCDNSFGNLLDLRYRYDLWIGDNGNVTQIINYRDQTRNQIFTYDPLNRLSSAQNIGADCTATVLGGKTKFWGNSYAYDAWGNLLGKTPTKCSAENLSVTASVKNQLQGGYTYDAAGNMMHDATANLDYTYDQENRITGAAGFIYTYDADGNRVKKANGTTGTLYWYMSLGIVGESDLAGNLTSEYVFFDGERVARKDFPGNAISYYFSDHLKTASVITDSAGSIKSESDYYPWGGELQFTNNDSNHYKFTGKERDVETRLDYFGARYYSNGLGRFITPDWSAVPVPVPYADLSDPQSLNQYSYVRNIPTSKADLDGHDCPRCPTLPTPTADDVKLIDEAGKRALAEEGAVGVSGTAVLTGAAIVFVPVMVKPDILPGGTASSDWPKDENGNYVNFNKQPTPSPGIQPKPQPAPNTQPKPQTPPAPQMAEHTKDKRRSTKDKHEKLRPGKSQPPSFKPFREYQQPKDDKKKDREKPPYHRKDRDKKEGAS